MTLLRIWVETSAAHALGWTLFHSLWQGALAALALAFALGVLRSSRTRYAAACLAMLAVLAAFALTFARVMPDQQVRASVLTGGARIPQLPGGVPFPMPPANWETILAPILPWLAPFWISGVLLFHLHGLAGWVAARRLRRTGVCCPPDPWQQALHRLGERVRLYRPVTLLESCRVKAPVVIGHLRPVILMPLGVLTNLPPGQVEAILLHELAHIRRFDYLLNLLQTAIEGLLFYHPAIWWISRVIRDERENCCDDLVVAVSGDAHGYALALAQLEENRSAALETALAATGGTLVKRIRRLLTQPEGPRASVTPVLCAGILTIAAAVGLTAWQSKPASAPPRSLLAQVQSPLARESNPDPYRRWLNQDVVYIINERERAAFENLLTNEERAHFIEQFWQRRDPTPGTVENEFKEEHYRRIKYANDRFTAAGIPGWQSDRGRIYVLYGPPDEIESHPSGSARVRYPFEDWLYRHIDNVGDNVIIEFVDVTQSGDYRMTRDPSAKETPPAETESAEARRVARDMDALGARVSFKTGAGVVTGNGTMSISVPLDLYGNHRVRVYLRVTAQAHRVIHVSEESIQAPAPAYTKSLRMRPGSYHVAVVVDDLATGVVAGDQIEFEVK